jgi:uncharacterized repeat protein (TIGR03803 family)
VPPGTEWTETVLYSFTGGTDGKLPASGVIFDEAGNLYGTTHYGGANGLGTVFELSPPAAGESQWTESVLYSFQGGTTDGNYPTFTGVVFDQSGDLYGVTNFGGTSYTGSGGNPHGCGIGCGVVYKLAPPATLGTPWTETVIHFFNGTDGAAPQSTPIFDVRGNLYGLTHGGGRYLDGTVYRLTPPAAGESTWGFRVLYEFGSGPSDSSIPQGSLTLHGKGVLYGTGWGGQYGNGTVFQVVPPAVTGGAWTESAIYSFSGGNDGSFPQLANVVFNAAGNIYGTTWRGGNSTECYAGCGTVFEVSPPEAGSSDWTETILHIFPATAKDGSQPVSGVMLGKHGELYGVTPSGGTGGEGAVYAIIP